ncbi:MAG: TetR/AcrR family transcriptional regulator [Actinobacteria bacterium]|nr:TetR/AcrR family transcriptional regulator [Actinomycetota bacterium]
MAPKAIEQTLREKVIKAAVKYVADNGPDGLSFRQIAADAGVSHQAPYHHFGDRSAIFGEIALGVLESSPS